MIDRFRFSRRVFAALIFLVLAHPLAFGSEILSSPDERLALKISLEDGSLRYKLDRDGAPFLRPGVVGLRWGKAAARWKEQRVSFRENETTWKPVWGKASEIRDEYREARVELTPENQEELPMSVVFRLYNEGLAFRFQIAKATGRPTELKIHEELTEFNFSKDATAWSYNGENENRGPEALSGISGARRLPMTMKFADGSCATMLEAEIKEIGWIDLKKGPGKLDFRAALESATVALPFESPWRVMIIGDTPGALVDASLLENLNPPCAIKDPSWIRPGVSFWDWRSWGYKAPDGFVYNLDMASWKRFIDYGQKTGVPSLLLDANWYGPEFDPAEDPTVSRDHLVEQTKTGNVVRLPAPADWQDPIDVPALIQYGKERGVGIFLYINDKARIRYDFEKTLATYQKWGAVGIKYGFMSAKNRQERVRKTREIIQLCAKYKLMCNFHDGPVPPSGDYRTWPNCVTREFCHSQSDAKKSFFPNTFNTSVFVNMVTGPIDMVNGMFALDNADKLRPRVFQPIPSTIVAECARALIVFSGQSVIPDAPDAYAAHPGLFAFIAAQKQPWLESETLMGEIGEFIVMRRTASDGTILIGAATNDKAREIELPLSFLGEGIYQAAIFEDGKDSDYLSNRETYSREEKTVVSGDSIKLSLAAGGGACVMISKGEVQAGKVGLPKP